MTDPTAESSPGAEARGRQVQDATDTTGPTGSERMLADATATLGKIHVAQVHREPWPQPDAFDPARYPRALRRAAAVQWAGRARAEHGSVHQFAALTHAFAEARVPLHVLGALARLITDEVRHAELCAATALAMYPEGIPDERRLFGWPVPKAPWRDAPRPSAGEGALLQWAAEAVLVANCIGEELSRPMLDALALVATDPLPESVCRQILRDEHLHATFGWEVLGWLMPRLDEEGRAAVQRRLARSLGGFERSTACGIGVAEVAESSITIERTTDPEREPNLGTLTDMQYAMIFYATLESDIFPRLRDLGLDPEAAWAAR